LSSGSGLKAKVRRVGQLNFFRKESKRESESEKRRNAKDLRVRPYRVVCQQADPWVVDPVGVRGCVMTMRAGGRHGSGAQKA
jgi:hypothetical protein